MIAAIEGYAVAGGMELAMWCDLRVMEENAIMGIFCRRFGKSLLVLVNFITTATFTPYASNQASKSDVHGPEDGKLHLLFVSLVAGTCLVYYLTHSFNA